MASGNMGTYFMDLLNLSNKRSSKKA